MAFLTGPAQWAAGEVAPVIIRMAIHTFFKSHTGVGPAGLVAGLALQCDMFPQKRIVGLPAVVKGASIGQPPALRPVAALAGIAEPLAVGILMTVGTELMGDVGEMQKLAVRRFG
jgi:hypothetical protein